MEKDLPGQETSMDQVEGVEHLAHIREEGTSPTARVGKSITRMRPFTPVLGSFRCLAKNLEP